jgi:hypothetical protein
VVVKNVVQDLLYVYMASINSTVVKMDVAQVFANMAIGVPDVLIVKEEVYANIQNYVHDV